MASINPYIHFNGNAEESFNFYKTVFDSNLFVLVRYKDIPNNPINNWDENEADKIMYIKLSIGKHDILRGNDTPSFMGKHNKNETRSKMFVTAESQEEAKKNV